MVVGSGTTLFEHGLNWPKCEFVENTREDQKANGLRKEQLPLKAELLFDCKSSFLEPFCDSGCGEDIKDFHGKERQKI